MTHIPETFFSPSCSGGRPGGRRGKRGGYWAIDHIFKKRGRLARSCRNTEYSQTMSSSQELQANEQEGNQPPLRPGLVLVTPRDVKPKHIVRCDLPLGEGNVAPGFIDFGSGREEQEAWMSKLDKFPVAKDKESLLRAVKDIVIPVCKSCHEAFGKLETATTGGLSASPKRQKVGTETGAPVSSKPNPLLKCLEDIQKSAENRQTQDVCWYSTTCVAGFQDIKSPFQTFSEELPEVMESTIDISGGMTATTDAMLEYLPERQLPKSLVQRIRSTFRMSSNIVVLYRVFVQITFDDKED